MSVPARSRKRSFERQGGVLYDEYATADGSRIRMLIPGSMMGEPVVAAERRSRRAEIGGDDAGRASRAVLALRDEHSPEMLDQLLVALSKRNISVPLRLTAYADDPRVQPALLDAVKTVPIEALANFAQGLGVVGGPGAREVLRARLQEALLDPLTFAPDPFFNWRAGSAATCAEALLRLDAEDHHAPSALVRLLDHVCERNRKSALRIAARLLADHRNLRTKPLRDLRAALTPLIDGRDDELFCGAAPALWDDARVPARMSRLLQSRSSAKQKMAVSVLWKLKELGWPMIVEWGARPRDPVEVLTTLGPNVRLLPEARRAEIAERGLANPSPSIRRDGAFVLATLDKASAAKLARHALKDEPDPAIRTKLAPFVKASARRPKAHRRRVKARIRTRRRIK